MPYDLLDLMGLVIWALVIIAGLLAFLYPFLERIREEPKREKP